MIVTWIPPPIPKERRPSDASPRLTRSTPHPAKIAQATATVAEAERATRILANATAGALAAHAAVRFPAIPDAIAATT